MIPTLARPHLLVRTGRQWFCDNCGRYASDGPSKAKLAHTECVGQPAVALGRRGKASVAPAGTNGQFRVVLQMWSQGNQIREEAWRSVLGTSEVAGACAKHTLAVERLAPQGETIPGISEAVHGANVGLNGFWITEETTWPKLEGASKDRLIIRLREAQTQPCMPDKRKHLLLDEWADQVVLEVWSARRQGQRAKAAFEDRLQWSSSYKGVRESTLSARQGAASEELHVPGASLPHW